MSHGVYVAGMGLVCPLGEGVPGVVEALRLGEGAPEHVDVAEGFAWPVHRLPDAGGAWLDRLAAHVREVAAQCGGVDPRADVPLLIGSSSLDAGFEEEGGAPAGPFAGDLQTFGDAVAQALAWRGPVFTVSTACTSSLNAVLAAMDLLQAGEATQALVLGVELRNRFSVAGFGAMQLLSPQHARPFGAGRDGLVLGEAVAALHLTAAPARWRLRGGANIADGRNPTGAQHDTILAVCWQALVRSGLQPADIGLVKPQAAGSPANDAIEAGALRALFGAPPPMASFKGAIGHALGASGAAELALLMGCAEAQAWPAMQQAPEPALGVAFAGDGPLQPRHILALSIGFGGGHAALVLEDGEA